MISDDAVSAFARDGVVVVRGLLAPNELELITVGIGKVMADQGSSSTTTGSPDEPGYVAEDLARWAEVDELGKIALRSGVAKTAAELMDSPTARFYHEQSLLKEAGGNETSVWRQDQPFFNVHGRGITAWISVDPVPKKGSPEFWAGSHLGPWRLPADMVEQNSPFFPDGTLVELPDIDADRSQYDIRRWALDPGDVLFFDFAVVHSAPGYVEEGRRRVLSLRYLSNEARHAQRPWPTTPEFPGLQRELPEGAEFDHPYFPLAWPR